MRLFIVKWMQYLEYAIYIYMCVGRNFSYRHNYLLQMFVQRLGIDKAMLETASKTAQDGATAVTTAVRQ